MTPEQAMNPANWERVKRNQFEARLRFNIKHLHDKPWPRLSKNEKILIKQEIQQTKDKPKFQEKGKVIEDLGYDTYLVQGEGVKPVKRHISQLKSLKEGEEEC